MFSSGSQSRAKEGPIMKPVELIGYDDEQHRLHADLPVDVQPGRVKILVRSANEEDEES